jgi:hypothetical protein
MAICVIVHNKQRSINLVNKKDRGIFNKPDGIFPESPPNSALRMLILKHPAQAGPPTNPTVCADHVGHRRTCFSSGKHVSLCNKISNLVSSPAVPLHTDMIFVNKSLFDQFGDAWDDRIIATFSGVTNAIMYIRVKNNITVTDVKGIIDGGALRFGMSVPVESFGTFFRRS